MSRRVNVVLSWSSQNIFLGLWSNRVISRKKKKKKRQQPNRKKKKKRKKTDETSIEDLDRIEFLIESRTTKSGPPSQLRQLFLPHPAHELSSLEMTHQTLVLPPLLRYKMLTLSSRNSRSSNSSASIPWTRANLLSTPTYIASPGFGSRVVWTKNSNQNDLVYAASELEDSKTPSPRATCAVVGTVSPNRLYLEPHRNCNPIFENTEGPISACPTVSQLQI